MGFDVTFHPIGDDELRRYFFDVLNENSIAEERAGELSEKPKEREAIRKLYDAFPRWLADKTPPGSTFAFAAAIIAGFLHPYWYARGVALTFLAEGNLAEMGELFVPLGKLALGSLASLPDSSRGMIHGNESASGLIPAERIGRVHALLESLASRPGRGGLSLLETVVDEDGLASLQAALHYCRERNLGMIEATDLVIPLADECITNYDNLRAPFLKKMAP